MERQQHDHTLIQTLEHTSERKTREYEEVYTQLTQQKTSTEVQKTHAYKLDLDLQESLQEITSLRKQSEQ
jgi:sugar diacid utilization regulator